ncbi:interaptin-like [Watersipora subatra]|uniref:interaptin-like n=1 Tax=Watersipora subatra TaxID=2589382 RepID=UPI00355B21B7
MERQIAELTQKLLDYNKKKKIEMDNFNRLLDECNKEKEILSEQQKKSFYEKNAEIERLYEEVTKVKSQSALGEYEQCLEENTALKRQTNELQLEFDLLKHRAESAEQSLNDIPRLKAKIAQLEAEGEELRKKKSIVEAAREKDELKDLDYNKLKHELKIARKDIELYQNGQPPSGSTAYIVRMRDETILQLHEKIADLERFGQQCRDQGFTPRSSTSTPRTKSGHVDDKAEMLMIMTEDSTRMKEKIDKLETDNVKLIELIKERDARIFEMRDEIEWLMKGSAQQELITTYTEKLRQGEEEMGQLHQTMEALTKRHSNLILAKENEMLSVRTNYAKQLSQLITECTSKGQSQEVEMRKLCNELDNLEKRNFELEKAIREYEFMKSEQIPNLRADLEALRKSRNDLRAEFDRCNQQLKEALREIDILEKDKVNTAKNHEVELANKQEELAIVKSELDVNQTNRLAIQQQRELETQRLRDELNNMAARLEERDGAVTHWKIKHEDNNRQIADMEERQALMLKAKNNEINTLAKQVEELSNQVDKASSVNDSELFRLQSQLKVFQRKHMDILEQNETTLKLKEDEMKRLYSEIGDMSAHLHTVNKDKEAEIQRLRKELSLLKEEKNAILAESQATMQEKQAEIRKLMVDTEKMEVDAARLHANKNQEVASLQSDYKQKMEQFMTDRAHLIAIKDNEIQNLKQEIDKLLNEARDGGSSIAEMNKQVFLLEQDKAELLMLKDQWQSDMDKLYNEYETCLADKADFQEMVDRISQEMEDRVEGLKQEHAETIKAKDVQIRDLYTKVERIAKERGDMSSHLHKILQEKEAKISELFQKLEEYDRCLDDAEQTFRSKLHKKSQEIKWLREEVRKMGEEGVRLLDMREQEIIKMRDHLKEMLKVMEHKYKGRTSSHVLITRPSQVPTPEPHLKPALKSSKSLKGVRIGKASSYSMTSASRTKVKRK